MMRELPYMQAAQALESNQLKTTQFRSTNFAAKKRSLNPIVKIKPTQPYEGIDYESNQ